MEAPALCNTSPTWKTQTQNYPLNVVIKRGTFVGVCGHSLTNVLSSDRHTSVRNNATKLNHAEYKVYFTETITVNLHAHST